MQSYRPGLLRRSFAAAIVALVAAAFAAPSAAVAASDIPIEIAQADTAAPELRPRYEPVPAEPPPAYNDEYIFAATRGVADSTMVPAVKATLFIFTIPLDLVLLPLSLIGGFF